jgi:GT2 family glycosyltransferase
MSRGDPWLSVIVPTYNGVKYVARALESVAAQVTEGIEVLVVDDGSTDETLAVVKRFERKLPLRLIPHPRVGNWVAITNIGLRAARGTFAGFLHQDDVWLPGRLAKMREAIQQTPSGRLFMHPAVFIGPEGQGLGHWRCPLRAGFIEGDEFVEHLLVQNFVAIASPVFERGAALRTGGLDESLWYTADWDLWLRLGAAGVMFVDQPLAAFRVHKESQTLARPRGSEELLQQMTTVLERHLAAWPARGQRRRIVGRVAEFSAITNAVLAATARGDRHTATTCRLATRFLRLGPAAWWRYYRDSRILERALPRIRLQLRRPS